MLVAKVLLKGVWGDSPSGAKGAKPPSSPPPEAVTSEAEEHAEG